MLSRWTRQLLRHLIIAMLCLCGFVCAEPPAEAPLPTQEQSASADTPPVVEESMLKSIAIKVSLLAALGIILALIPGTRMNVFENGVDIFFSCVSSCVFCVLLLYEGESIPLTNRVIGMSVLAVLLIPYALIANSGRIWTLLVILPARLVLAVLVLFCGVCFFLTSMAAAAGRGRRGARIFSASFSGLATLGVGKLIQYTTRSYRGV